MNLKRTIILLALVAAAGLAQAQGWVSVQSVGVLPTNTPRENRQHLQEAIDNMSPLGGVLYVEPARGGYPMEGGLVLKRNVTLLGAHGPTGRGTALPDRSGPTGSLFVITDREQAVALEMLRDVIEDLVLVEVVPLDQELRVKDIFEHGGLPPFYSHMRADDIRPYIV